MDKPQINTFAGAVPPVPERITEIGNFIAQQVSKQDHLSDIQAEIQRQIDRLDAIANRLDPDSYSKNISKCADGSESQLKGASTSPALPGGINGQLVKSVLHWEGLLSTFHQRILPAIDEAIAHIEKHI